MLSTLLLPPRGETNIVRAGVRAFVRPYGRGTDTLRLEHIVETVNYTLMEHGDMKKYSAQKASLKLGEGGGSVTSFSPV